MWIDVIYNNMSDIGILAKHVKQHSSTTYKWFNIGKLLPLQFTRQMLIEL